MTTFNPFAVSLNEAARRLAADLPVIEHGPGLLSAAAVLWPWAVFDSDSDAMGRAHTTLKAMVGRGLVERIGRNSYRVLKQGG